jgi:hypothetical protein
MLARHLSSMPSGAPPTPVALSMPATPHISLRLAGPGEAVV